MEIPRVTLEVHDMTIQTTTDNLELDKREQLAAYAHEAWSGWMRFMFKHGTFRCSNNNEGELYTIWIMPDWAVGRWQRQMKTPYADLPESEKTSDRAEADKMLAIMGE